MGAARTSAAQQTVQRDRMFPVGIKRLVNQRCDDIFCPGQ